MNRSKSKPEVEFRYGDVRFHKPEVVITRPWIEISHRNLVWSGRVVPPLGSKQEVARSIPGAAESGGIMMKLFVNIYLFELTTMFSMPAYSLFRFVLIN